MTLIRCVDFETTGMPEDAGAAICEVGWCDIHSGETPVVHAPTAMLCNPGRPMPPVARAVHHISDADVERSPPPAEGLRLLAAGAPAIFVAHNAKFEQHFFPDAPAPWICTWKVALRLWPDAPSHSNQVLRYFLDLDIGDNSLAMPPHRAGPDSYVTAHLFAKMLTDRRTSIDEMVRWSSGPPLLTTVTFGKHRGAKWDDLPTDYLQWIANKSDLDSDTKANARHRLKSRAAA